MKRKRAPGGGRKPKGAVAARPVTVRMPDDLRAEFEAALRKRGGGWTLTDELVGRLRASFAREHEERRDPVTRALMFLISTLARDIDASSPKEWHRDPFAFRAFRLGVARLLEALEPPGDIRPAVVQIRDQYRPFETPESFADFAAEKILYDLFYSRPLTIDRRTLFRDKAALEGRDPVDRKFHEALDGIERHLRLLERARRALQVTSKRGERNGKHSQAKVRTK